jgi:CheY-like chemotaxis protein
MDCGKTVKAENKKKILVVDDEVVIRNMLSDHLEDRYDVASVKDGRSALDLEDLGVYDLVISDINMPGLKGYEVLSEIKKKHPRIHTVLITAYNVDEYIRLAKNYGISNIISKTTPFNFSELDTVVENLISRDIFGIEKYMLPQADLVKEFVIKNSRDGKNIREELENTFQEKVGNVGELKLVLDEIITNAIYHSPQNDEGREKYGGFYEVNLKKDEFIYISAYMDKEKYGIAIVDYKGNLKKDTVIFKLDRHINAEGMLDGSGRGIYMSRIFCDRLIINIDPGKKTEVLVINYRNENYKGYKPLYINEL